MAVRWYIVPSELVGGIFKPKYFAEWNRTDDPGAAWTDYDIGKQFLVAANWQANYFDEHFTSDHDVFVQLSNSPIELGSVEIPHIDPAEDFPYQEGTDYEIEYTLGQVKALSTGSMPDATLIFMDYSFPNPAHDAKRAVVEADTDVWVFPLDIDVAMGAQQSNSLEAFVEPLNLPGNFLGPQETNREAMRKFGAMFIYIARLSAQQDQSPFDVPGFSLNLQWSNIPVDWQAAMIFVADSLGFPTTSMTGNTLVRNIMIDMAETWASHTLNFKFVIL